ncbi:Mlp family lipoprotein (plasmid) [Borrelia puertoricensis]|uniref:Mlp family lipoprotein n=1 Tax=Borrelia puertoricensis TaxID=2756107 RepID=UPI003EC050EF
MNKINFILILLLLISSCEYEHGNATPKSRSKRDLSNEREQVEVQKTPEDALREKLNDSQKQGLEFLKDALGSESKFNQFLSFDDAKIKAALDHIKTQLESCKDNAANGKDTFKQVVQGYFSKMDESTLNGFKENATSTCQAGAGG